MQSVLLLGGSFLVGTLGGLLGVGGGIFLVPFLTLAASLRPVEAVGVSLCCVIGTSAASSFVALRGEANLGLALLLEPFLVLGAAVSAIVAQRLSDRALLLAFAGMILGIAVLFAARKAPVSRASPVTSETPRFFDGTSAGVPYRTARVGALLVLGTLSGAAAGLFGVGGGVLVIPALVFVGRLPLRAAASTSALALMTTAGAGAAIHISHGTVRGDVVALALLGVFPGGLLGGRLQARISERSLRFAFVALATITAAVVVKKALP